ncbi:MAG: hypothetical protein OEV40_03620 [Acidimicrobiia bacterium]|nr:hypothetical protein [Acidimicrobiia bacterium]
MVEDFIDGIDQTNGIGAYAVFDDERPLQVRAPDPTAFYEAFVAVQQLGEHLAREVRAEGLVAATFFNREEQYLYRTISSDEGRVSVAFQADAGFDLAATVDRIDEEARGGSAADQPPPPTAADAMPANPPPGA